MVITHIKPEEYDEQMDEGETPAPPHSSRTDAEIEKEFASIEFSITQEKGDFLLEQVRDFVETKRWMNLHPEYQRRKRWTNQKKSSLAESLLMNLPVPPVFLFEHEPARYEVMDGQQRLSAIIDLYSDKLVPSNLRYWPELNGRPLSKWPKRLKTGLERRRISTVVLRANPSLSTTTPEEIRRQVFERLNTGGLKLNAQELRNCIYEGRLNEVVVSLSKNESLAEAFGIPSPKKYEDKQGNATEPRLSNPIYAKMGDCQLVLRFLAFRQGVSKIKGSVRSILDRFMDGGQGYSDAELAVLQDSFNSAIARCVHYFGQHPFTLPDSKKPSIALFDAMMVAFDRHPEFKTTDKASMVSQAKERLAKKSKNKAFAELMVGRANTAASITDRISEFEVVLGA